MKLYRLLALGALALVAACATKGTNDVLAAMTTYQAALNIAVAYNDLPRCATGGPSICSDQNVVAQMRKANQTALVALQGAENVVTDPNASQSAIGAALSTANQAVSAFTSITAIYKPQVQ